MASSQYGVTLKQLRDLMELRGKEGVDKLQEVGGSQGLCKKLKTSEANGKERIRKEGRKEGMGVRDYENFGGPEGREERGILWHIPLQHN